MRGPLGNPRSFKSFCMKRELQTGRRQTQQQYIIAGTNEADGHASALGARIMCVG